jgi:beta-aspartyl-peptidase (threonine type)
MEAVETAVRYLECDEYFNAGYGSVLTTKGTVEMDASVMDGRSMKFGCCCTIEDILHPISISREILKQGGGKFLGGKGAMNFAKYLVTYNFIDFIKSLSNKKVLILKGFKVLDPPGQLVTDYSSSFMDTFVNTQVLNMNGRKSKRKNTSESDESSDEPKGEVGTVGAVAIDRLGNIAVATSTGGLSGKMPGRIGDTPIIGAGTYADNKIAGVSATGHGETIARACLAHDVVKRMEYLGEDVQTASQNACKRMTKDFKGELFSIYISYQEF